MSGTQTLRPGPGDADPAPAAAARRRYLTILFSDLVGSTRLAGAMEAEDYERLALRPLRDAWQEVIPAFGGIVNETIGDGVLAVFGWPEANEGDGRMATLAALALHDRMRALDGRTAGAPSLRLHSGVHSGLVLVRETRGGLDLLGSAINVASRLATAAKADEIVVSEATLGPDRGAFVTSERLHLRLKGKEKAISAFRVLDRAPEGTRYAARERKGLSPFVGRRPELDRLSAVVDRVAAGDTRFVSIVGPPGVGKTRLVSELLSRRSADLHVYRAECDAHLGAEPLQPFLQILRSALGVSRTTPGERPAEAIQAALGALGADLAEHGEVLLRLLAPSERPRRPPRAAAAAAALQALLARVAEGEPLALFIDDWQWADDASRRLLQALREMAWPRLLVLLTMRGEGASERFDNFERLDLTPFSDAEAAAAVRQVLPHVDPFRLDDICAAAGGNPLFIEELCHSAAYGEQDFRTHEGSGWLDVLIGSRFARLPDDQAGLLAVAAVIGNIIPVWLLEQVTGHGEDDPLVRALGEQDFIFPGERAATLRFKHGITRDVIYDSVGLRERRALHLKIAEAFRDHGAVSGEDEFYEALAYHYGAGGDAAAAATYAALAGDKALERSASDRAHIHYRAALRALDRLPRSDQNARQWQKIARRFGLASAFDPSADQLPILEEAVQRAAARNDALALALAQYWLGYINYALGRTLETIGCCERAVDAALPLGEERLVLQIRALLGQARALVGDYQQALALLDEALGAMRRDMAGAGTPIAFAYSLSCKGFVLADLGRFAEAQACFEEALGVVGGSDHPVESSILEQYQAAGLWQGHFGETERIAAKAHQVSTRARAFYNYARNRSAEAYGRWVLTGDESAPGQLIEATGWLEESGRELFLSLNYGWLCEMMAAAGETARARHYAARALVCARRRDRLGEAMSYRALAGLAESAQGPKRADHYLDRAMAAAQFRNSPHEIATTRLHMAEIALGRGERSKAIALLDEADAAFAEMDMKWHAERSARLREAEAD